MTPPRTTGSVRHRPNLLFLLPGLLLIIVGIVVMVGGILYAVSGVLNVQSPQLSDLGVAPNPGADMAPLLDGFAVAVVGCTVMTVGRYLWRGARRRGFRDRFGRFLIIVSYIDVAVALVVLTRFILSAFGSGVADASEGVIIRGLITCVAIAVPGALLAMWGFRLAKEEPLMEAEVKADL